MVGLRIRCDLQSLDVVLFPTTSDHLMRDLIWPNAIETPHAHYSLLDIFVYISAGGFSENGSNWPRTVHVPINFGVNTYQMKSHTSFLWPLFAVGYGCRRNP